MSCQPLNGCDNADQCADQAYSCGDTQQTYGCGDAPQKYGCGDAQQADGCGAPYVNYQQSRCAPVAPPTCTNTVTMFKMEPYEVQVPYKKTVMVDKVVPTVESKQVPREVASTKQVTQMVAEPYMKTVTAQVPCTKKVMKPFTVNATRQVTQMVKVPTTINVPVQKWVDDVKTVTKYKTVPYTVEVPTKKLITTQEQRESFKMEKVAKTVPYNKIVTRWVDVPATKTITKQIISSRKVKKISIVSSTKTVMETVKIVGAKTIKVPQVIDAMRTVTKYRQVPYQKTVEAPCPVQQPCAMHTADHCAVAAVKFQGCGY